MFSKYFKGTAICQTLKSKTKMLYTFRAILICWNLCHDLQTKNSDWHLYLLNSPHARKTVLVFYAVTRSNNGGVYIEYIDQHATPSCPSCVFYISIKMCRHLKFFRGSQHYNVAEPALIWVMDDLLSFYCTMKLLSTSVHLYITYM